MMPKMLLILLPVLLLAGCIQHKNPTYQQIDTIAFGSCNKQDKKQPFWPLIQAQNPDLWIWLGDNIYADTDNMSLMTRKYRQQKEITEYREFIKNVPVTGIWDDHDYGMNDGNRTFSHKAEAKNQFIDFLDIPKDDAIHQHEGIYRSYVYGSSPYQVKVLLLDTRTFQSPLSRTTKESAKNYVSQPNGAMLGEQQWQWLEKELRHSNAAINIIASSLQVIAEDHRYEMWANFPDERKRLLDLIVNSKVKNPIILSGDRHLSEISKVTWQGIELIDITSSGLTHSFSGSSEYNRHREGNLITDESFSVLQINWPYKLITIKQLNMQGKTLNQHKLVF